MGTAVLRRLLLTCMGLSLVSAPAAARPAHDRGSAEHCQHQASESDHQQHHDATGCEHSDACQDCTTPACHTASHCGPSASGILVSAVGTGGARVHPAVPVTAAPSLSSIEEAPPTHPPLFSR